MNQNGIPFERQKNAIELSLARTILTQLQNGGITHDQSQDIAQFILNNIDEARTEQELSIFLQQLSSRWIIFDSLYNLYKLKSRTDIETETKLEETKKQLEQIIH